MTSAWEECSRVPFIARCPKQISTARVSDEMLSTMHLLPTSAQLTGASLPSNRSLDGQDTSSFLTGKSEHSPREEFLYYSGCLLTGVRVGSLKLGFSRDSQRIFVGMKGIPKANSAPISRP